MVFETHLIEPLKERTYTSLEDINRDIKEKVAVLNSRKFQNRPYSRLDAFERYDKPCMKPLPHEIFTVFDYKAISKVPDNYHIEYDGHYYYVVYTQCGKPGTDGTLDFYE